MDQLAKRIRICRLNRALSQKKMAEKLNISQSAYAKIENGFSRLDMGRLYKICEILDIKPEILIEDITSEKEQVLSGHKAQIIDKSDIHKAYFETIRNLKEEIKFLRSLLKSK